MFDHIYVEQAVLTHPRTQAICTRFASAEVIVCDRYAEVFNRKSQDFRLQKQNPSLILARKEKGFVLPTPEHFGIGGKENYYFSHLLNCLYDCRYCFLQGMYRSANFVLFVNYEDFDEELAATANSSKEQPYFFSGYDCDSLALDSVTGFSDHILSTFAGLPEAWLELRTKSVNIRPLLSRPALANVVVAFSMTPEAASQNFESGVPPLHSRLAAMSQLADAGWPIGLRIDPLIYSPAYETDYQTLLKNVFETVAPDKFHSVSLGPMRFPKAMYDRIVSLYPESKLLAGPLERRGDLISYKPDLEAEMTGFCTAELQRFVSESKIFSCLPEDF